MTDTKDMAMLSAKILDSRKAQDILVIDITGKASFADYLVLASGGNERQVGALAQDVEDGLAKEGILVKSIEGKKESGWILMDYGDIIVNIFSIDTRSRYNVEKVWSDCDFIELEEGN